MLTREAELLADCIAYPDDDGPRLVWADHVGGERGELVVLQCDLARGGLSDLERQARKQREHELLARHAVEWAGEIPKLVARWSFRRGFVEAVRVDTLRGFDGGKLRSLAPISAVTLTASWTSEVSLAKVEPLRGITALALIDIFHQEDRFEQLAPVLTTFGVGLRALAIDNLTTRGLEAAIEIIRRSPIERLRFRHLRLTPSQLAELLAAAPRLRALDLEPSPLAEEPDAVPRSRAELIAAAATLPLHALRLGPVATEDLAPLVGSKAATTLERLGYAPLGGVDLAATLPRMRVLATPPPDELLHPAADALLDLGEPWFTPAPAFWIVRLDRIELFDIPSRPADETVEIGRSTAPGVAIRIAHGSVARRHARLRWHDDHYKIWDLETTNGVMINDLRVPHHALADGDTVKLGVAVLRFFIGPGAEQRAKAAALPDGS